MEKSSVVSWHRKFKAWIVYDIYQLGLTNLFIELGLLVIKKLKIETLYAHLDSTSFHLHGEYNNIETAENDQEKPILITKGYSRNYGHI